MKNYVIINGVNSLTITGLAISKLPSISKPPLRVMTEEINGRDGDLITELGYGAYDKELVIGLYGNYDINEVIGFFNQEGTIVFSNEDDKYYNFKIINQIDYEALIKFRTATINLHCQPFKYPLTETPEEIITEYVEEEGETLTLNDTKIAPLSIDLKGNTNQNGTPTPSSPIQVNVVSGDNEIDIVGKNLWNNSQVETYSDYVIPLETGFRIYKTANGRISPQYDISLNVGETYTISCNLTKTASASKLNCEWFTSDGDILWQPNIGDGETTITPSKNVIGVAFYLTQIEETGKYFEITNFQIEKGSTATTYTPYTGNTYPINLPVRNLTDIHEYLGGSVNSSGVIANNSGITEFTNVDGIITFTTSQNNRGTYSGYIAIQPNTDYIVSFKKEISTPTYIVRLNWYDSTKTFISRVQQNTYSTSPSTAKYLVIYIEMTTTGTGSISEVQLEQNTKSNSYTPYGTTPIELNKIGTYQDYIYKDSGKWYLHKEVGKVVLDGSESDFSYTNGVYYSNTYMTTNYINTALYSNYFIYGGTGYNTSSAYNNGNNVISLHNSDKKTIYIRNDSLTSLANWQSWLSTHDTIIYFILQTPTETEITNTTLINQLEALKGAMSYEGQTNISQVNNDLPFILKVKGTKEGSGEGIINNIGNIYAKPIIELEGTGNIGIYKNDTQYFEVDMSSDNEITIDTEKMEAYHNGVLKNRKVIGDYNKFTIDEGNNNIEITGELTKATITKYTRYL